MNKNTIMSINMFKFYRKIPIAFNSVIHLCNLFNYKNYSIPLAIELLNYLSLKLQNS
jgi:hypothetical protein